MAPRYARVIVAAGPAHLDHPFDYLVPDGEDVTVGQRVRVTFAGRRRTGWVVGVGTGTDTDPARIRPLDAVQGSNTWFDAEDLRLYRWVARRWAGSLADVLRHALPPRVAAVERDAQAWDPPAPPRPGPEVDRSASKGGAGGQEAGGWRQYGAGAGGQEAGGWEQYGAAALLKAVAAERHRGVPPAYWVRWLPGDDVAALTGELVNRCLSAGRHALVLAPDPASPVLDVALAAAGRHGADLRVRSDRARYRAFLRCRTGHARVAVGERGAVFTPVRNLGLLVVDDEANPAYKERRSPRHHARDVALARARMAGATCVLGGDLPSAALWRLLEAGHVETVEADRATQRRRAPRVDVVDLSARPHRTRFAGAGAQALTEAVRSRGAAVVLAARGGEGSALACHRCGLRFGCPVCDGSLRPRDRGWQCPTCEWHGAPFDCRACGSRQAVPLAAGAARLAAELARSHPEATVARMEGFDAPGPASRPAIGVMTRGSVVARPAWLDGEAARVVVIPDADAMARRPSYDAAEDALRLWMASARWTCHVVVQTREPAHPAVQALVRWDAVGFWRREMGTRAELGYPPARALVRVTSPPAFAPEVRKALVEALPDGDEILGPDLDGGLLVKSAHRRGTLAALTPLRHEWGRDDRQVRVDVDPVDAG